jgi:hypothetical protein
VRSFEIEPDEFTGEFVDVWLEDYYVRSLVDAGLAQQMEDFARFEYGVSTVVFTEALIAALVADGELA